MFALQRATFVAVTVIALAGVPTQEQALWIEPSGRLRPEAHEAIALLEGAAAEGLDPADYAVPAEDSADFDRVLTARTLRYLEDVRFGRMNPRALGIALPPRDAVDLAGMLREAVAAHRVSALAAELSPRVPMYAELRRELARYKALADDPRLRTCGDLPACLAAFGDLSSGSRDDADSVIEGIQSFQRRHGLEPDGVAGPATRKALAVPLAWRVRQIELSLERLRWLPRFAPQRILAVNIPMFRLWGMGDASVAPFSTEAIVGRALSTRTPVLLEQMEYVVFRPYWNVPASIVRGEILPAAGRAPDYLHRHSMEIVAGESDAARVVPATPETLAALRGGRLRLRQRPGPDNALGLIKFVFPNDEHVYIHGTPAPGLFARPRRDFSHGCIRVADPLGLAEWVLSGKQGWSRARIAAAVEGPGSSRVDLGPRMPVILFYLTAMPVDGALHFAEDIYGHDAQLDRYLAGGQRHAP